MTRVLRPVGDRAVLAECGNEAPAGLAAAIRAAAMPGVRDVVPAATTVLVTVDRASAVARLTQLLRHLPALEVAEDDAEVVLRVHYDGPDLAAVAAALGMGADDVVTRHRRGSYRVAFCGFSPGFAYLTGLDPSLHLPRRGDPRTRVPPGSVAIAGPYSAVYPRPSPGGWHLIGTCDTPLWDPAADPPAILAPGARVRFAPS